MDRITFYSGIVRSLAPIRAELQAQMHDDDVPQGLTYLGSDQDIEIAVNDNLGL